MLCVTKIALPFVWCIAVRNKGWRELFFFCFFFLFSKEKKKGVIAQQTPKNSIDRLHKQQAERLCDKYRKGQLWRLQAQADSEGNERFRRMVFGGVLSPSPSGNGDGRLAQGWRAACSPLRGVYVVRNKIMLMKMIRYQRANDVRPYGKWRFRFVKRGESMWAASPTKSPCPIGHLLPSRPLCHFVTFPHPVGNHPFQGRLGRTMFAPTVSYQFC